MLAWLFQTEKDTVAKQTSFRANEDGLSNKQVEFYILQPDLIDRSNWNFLYVLICCVRDSFQIPLCWWSTMSDRFINSSRLVYLGILKTNIPLQYNVVPFNADFYAN